MLMTEIAETAAIAASNVFVAVERLQRLGLTIKSPRVRGRTYVALNPRFAASAEMRSLLRALDRIWPATKRIERSAIRGEIRARRPDRSHASQNPMRSVTLQVLGFLAVTEAASLRTMERKLRLSNSSIADAVNLLEKGHVLESRHSGRLRLVTLNRQFAAYPELRAFLRRIAC
jgi:DNA-binding IclR family transcriptional regulator